MSDELTQLRAARKVLADFIFEAFRSSDQGAKKIKEAHKALDLLLAITPPGEADTKPLVDRDKGQMMMDVAVMDKLMAKGIIYPHEQTAWSRIRQALQPHGEADRSPILDQGATPCKGCGKSPCGSSFVSVDDDEPQGET